jgi:hypothetical protein
MTLEQARGHIGDGVVYRAGRRYGDGYGPTEDGVITSVNDRYVFVRYAGDQNSKATAPELLILLAAG